MIPEAKDMVALALKHSVRGASRSAECWPLSSSTMSRQQGDQQDRWEIDREVVNEAGPTRDQLGDDIAAVGHGKPDDDGEQQCLSRSGSHLSEIARPRGERHSCWP